MWIVAKIKKRELHLFKKELIKKFSKGITFYNPKVQYSRYFKNKTKKIEKFILENYIFCYHKKFQEANFIREIRFLKGLDYFLQGHQQNQDEIVRFVNHCKSFENKDGYLTQGFFKTMILRKAQFVSGPFVDMVFEIIEKQKNKLKVLVGNITTTISDKGNYLYRHI